MTAIAWRYYSRAKANPQPWSEARRMASLVSIPRTYEPAVFHGVVQAVTRDEAMVLARALVSNRKLVVDVICEAAWRTLTPLERDVFLGTFTPPQDRPRAAQERPQGGICRICHAPIPRNATGRPRTYCDDCVPPELQRSRRYQDRLKAARE